MTKLINIHTEDERLDLDARTYWINVLGGWGVNVGDFSILLTNIETREQVKCRRAFWAFQFYSFEFDERAKVLFTIRIPTPGTYRIEFKNANNLKVKHSNLFFSSLSKQPIPNSDLVVYFS